MPCLQTSCLQTGYLQTLAIKNLVKLKTTQVHPFNCFVKSQNVHPQLGVHFSSENNGIWRAQLIVQDTAKAKSLAWKAFGQRPIDGWLYGNRQLNAGMDYSIIWT